MHLLWTIPLDVGKTFLICTCLFLGGTITSHLEAHFSPPFCSKRTLTQLHYALTRHTYLVVWRYQHNTLMCWQLKPRQISKYMETRPLYHMGLIHQTVWGLIWNSHRGDPLNVGGSNTVNKIHRNNKPKGLILKYWVIINRRE